MLPNRILASLGTHGARYADICIRLADVPPAQVEGAINVLLRAKRIRRMGKLLTPYRALESVAPIDGPLPKPKQQRGPGNGVWRVSESGETERRCPQCRQYFALANIVARNGSCKPCNSAREKRQRLKRLGRNWVPPTKWAEKHHALP